MNVSLGVWNGVCGSEGVSEKLKKRVSDVHLCVREEEKERECVYVCVHVGVRANQCATVSMSYSTSK